MIRKPSRDTIGRTTWVAMTDDGEIEAMGQNPLDAVTRLAENLEEHIWKKLQARITSQKLHGS